MIRIFEIIILFPALFFRNPIRVMVNGIIKKMTIKPKIFKRTEDSIFSASIFEAIYTPLTAKLKIIELAIKRMLTFTLFMFPIIPDL